MQYIYLHGFASSPQSHKAQYLADRFREQDLDLQLLDLNQNDFTNLTLTRQINQTVAQFNQTGTPVTLIGSSFGGLTSVWLAEKYHQIQRLVLLAPAFNFVSYWSSKLGAEEIQKWQKSGFLEVYHYKEDKPLPLSYRFYEDITQYKEDKLQQKIPTLILHGKNDETIPLQASLDYAKQRPEIKLISLDSDHGLRDKMEVIWQETKSFCSL
ncbi:MAG: YqiA/YcfP family alpha/beta fold hydrolase [Cyanobacteria bacterium P01_F01_bin.143]